MRDRKKAAAPDPSNRGSRHEATTPNACRFFQLPNALILDILSRLPIKDLHHCKRVCKRFLCFVSDHEFASLHHSRSSRCVVFFTRPTENASKRLQLAHVDADGENFQVSELNFTPNVPTCDIFHATACNDLLLFVLKGDYFFVCNPILGESITIKPPFKNRHRSSCFGGLGYSSLTNQYKLLHSYYTDESTTHTTAEIYTIGTGTWRSIGNGPTDLVYLSLPFNAFLNGALHWPNISPGVDEFIHSFDFDTEQFGRVPLPDNLSKVNLPKIGVVGGCLFVIPSIMNPTQVDMWVMKEYGVKESWTKQFVFEYVYTNGCVFHHPMVFSGIGEMFILYNNDAIACYNPKTKRLQAEKSFQTCSRFYPVAYTPSFVSLYKVAKGEQISRYFNRLRNYSQ